LSNKVIYTYHALMIWEPGNKPNKPSKSRSLKLEEKKNLHANWAYENNKRRVKRRRGNLLRGRRNQQLEGVCHLLEYGYQQHQFCKMSCFCIPVLLNESSPPFPGLFFFTAIFSIKINILVLGCDWFYELFYYHIQPMI